MKPIKLTFSGATGTVTGSKYLLSIKEKHFLVDCGLFQGYKELRLRNWEALPFKPDSLEAVLLTHAHIDHSGYLPLLVKNGFNGLVYATKATKELCSILLPDSGHIHEEDAKRANMYGYSKHHPALPLYTEEDGYKALTHFVDVEYNRPLNICSGCQAIWYPAGHILGSSLISIQCQGIKILFSGDLGRPIDPIMKPPAVVDGVDYLILESTYGNRLHTKDSIEDQIAKIVNKTVNRDGTILIPAFAVGRTQSILYYLYQLKKNKKIPDIPIFLDSPMAIDATKILQDNSNEHQFTPEICAQVCKTAKYINNIEESRSLDKISSSKIIISASGMMTGGRILHHLKVYLPNPKNMVLFSGFQAGGTRGARILAGEKAVKIHGEMYPVRAQIATLTNTSAHADYEEMLQWLQQMKTPPKTIYITHGEPEASKALKEKIENNLGWNCYIPEYLEEVFLGG